MPSPEERARLLDPAQDPPRPAFPYASPAAREWMARADARLAALREVVEVLAATSTAWPARAISPELALMWATAAWTHKPMYGGAAWAETTPEDYLEAMMADGLRVRGRGTDA